MSNVRRFLSVRDRDKSKERKHHLSKHGDVGHHEHLNKIEQSSTDYVYKAPDASSPSDFYGLFDSSEKPSGHAEEFKLKALRQRVVGSKGVSIRDGTVLWALRSRIAFGDDDLAYKLLLALSDASEGMVTDYDPTIKMKGAQNRQGVTCFLDSVLFSMFSRLDSFEAMLYNAFDDLPRRRLSFVLRFWVNLLRTGQLITTDITKILQEAIAECGWLECAELHQQDASEAFTFITGKLELPLLTLKMDIFHTGKEDTADDHKFINERLLDVAIPEDPTGQRKEITLEDCLEAYFNNRIEVRRYLERRSTMTSTKSPTEAKSKGNSIHVEIIETDADSSPSTPTTQFSPTRPMNKIRSPSIIQERYIPARSESGHSSLSHIDTKGSSRSRAGSVRKEVMMPAWQFFSLIPWYTDHAPSNDAQVAAHFSSKRPVLGLCLKRYAFQNGRSVRLNTYVDIPIEIGLPHFIQDDHMSDDMAPFGSFKLSLQSAVCHRGNSVTSGHYVALVRGTSPSDTSSYWLRFDDLAAERITLIDVEKALKEETPYLLFYQIVPVEGDPGLITVGEQSRPASPIAERRGPDLSSTSLALTTSNNNNASSGRPSVEVTNVDDARGRSSQEARRPSAVSFTDAALAMMKPSLRNPSPGKENHSRSGSDTLSRSASNGIGRTLSKLRRKSREPIQDISILTPPEENMGPAGNARELTGLSIPAQGQLPQHIKTTALDVPQQHPPVHHSQQNQQHQPVHHSQQNQHLQPSQQTHQAHQIQPAPHNQPPHPGHGTHKRDKSKNRLAKGKGKDHHPDRECSVM